MADTEPKTTIEVIPLQDFRNAEINALLAGNQGSDTFALAAPLREARSAAEERGNGLRRKVLGFLHDLLNIHLRVDDRAIWPHVSIASGANVHCKRLSW
jgi:hypothetical protein